MQPASAGAPAGNNRRYGAHSDPGPDDASTTDRDVPCLSAGGNIGCSILRTGIAAGVMAEKVRNRRARAHRYPAQAAKALQSALPAGRHDWLAIGWARTPGYALSLTGGD